MFTPTNTEPYLDNERRNDDKGLKPGIIVALVLALVQIVALVVSACCLQGKKETKRNTIALSHKRFKVLIV